MRTELFENGWLQLPGMRYNAKTRKIEWRWLVPVDIIASFGTKLVEVSECYHWSIIVYTSAYKRCSLSQNMVESIRMLAHKGQESFVQTKKNVFSGTYGRNYCRNRPDKISFDWKNSFDWTNISFIGHNLFCLNKTFSSLDKTFLRLEKTLFPLERRFSYLCDYLQSQGIF